MGNHVDYDTDKRIIYVTTAPSLVDGDWVVDLDIKTDVYSDGKEDWLANDTLNKFYFPVRSVGGDDLPGEKSLGATFFLDSGWKLKPYEANHTFKVNGNFYSEDGTSPFVSTSGVYNIMVINTVSSLVDSIVQQLTEIEYSSFGGGVTVDVVNGRIGTAYPIGTPQEPAKSLIDAVSIADSRGFNKLFIKGNITITNTVNFQDYIIQGETPLKTKITLEPTALVSGTEFENATITGTLDGNNSFHSCFIQTLNFIEGHIHDCLLEEYIITLGGSTETIFLNCWSFGASQDTVPIIDMAGSGKSLALKGYSGGIKLINKTGPETAVFDFESGRLLLDSTVTAGNIIARGVVQVIDDTTGTAVVNTDGVVSQNTIADAIWTDPHAVSLISGMSFIENIEGGRWKIENNQMIFYEQDNTTEIMRFNLFDESGDPANTDIFDRRRV